MKTLDIKNNSEDLAESERIKQAYELVSTSILFSCYPSPGEYIKRYGHKFPRLSELKSHHFNYRIK